MFSTSTRRRRRLRAFATMVALLASLFAIPTWAAAAPTPWQLVDLGLTANSQAHAINSSGDIVGEDSHRAFLWRDGQVTHLDSAASYSVATDINNRGEVVGFRVPGGAFLWRDGVMIDLGGDFAWAINDRGVVVGQAGASAFSWRDGVITYLESLPGAWLSTAYGINNAGLIVGQSGTMNPVAVQWRLGSGVQPLPTAAAVPAVAVNDRGQIVSGRVTASRAYLWQRDEVTVIEPLPAHSTVTPFGINNRGQVVGDSIGRINEAFVWQNGRFTMLPLLATTVGGTAHDINDRGQVVGFAGTAPPGGGLEWHAVLWTR